MTESSSEFYQESFSLKRGQDATGFVNTASVCEGIFGILTHSTCAWIPNKAGSKRCCGWPSPVVHVQHARDLAGNGRCGVNQLHLFSADFQDDSGEERIMRASQRQGIRARSQHRR